MLILEDDFVGDLRYDRHARPALKALDLGSGVNLTPGNIFFPDGTNGDHCLRLNFVIQPPDEIEEGIKRLAIK